VHLFAKDEKQQGKTLRQKHNTDHWGNSEVNLFFIEKED